MGRKHFLILIIAILALISNASSSAAQGTSLRDLADLNNNFHIGAAVQTTHLIYKIHADTLSREFNTLTPENEAKFCVIQASQGDYDFRKFDELVDFAEKNNMVVRGHNLVWHQCVPNWLTSGTFTRDEAIKIMHDHIFAVLEHYKGKVPMWDVVNEAIADDGSGLRTDSVWRKLIGDDYVEMAFRFAHEADPNVLLFYNDYGGEGLGKKSDAIYAMMQDFVKRGVPINGVGLQMHIKAGDTAPGGYVEPKTLGENMQRLGALGLQVQVTEMDVKYDGHATDQIWAQQAGDYHNVLETCLDNKNCTAFVLWGVTDSYTWLRNARYSDNLTVGPLLFDDKYKPKLAYSAVQDVLSRHAGKGPILSDEQLVKIIPTKPAAATIPAPTKSDPAQLAPDSVQGVAYYAPFPVSIKLDGDESDWKNVPRATVDKGPTIPAGNESKVTFAAAADATNLYFLADVKDSKIIYGKHDPATEWYMEDSVEFYINATGDLTLVGYKKGVAQIGIMAANLTKPAKPIIGGSNGGDSDVSVVMVKTDDGYRVEASVSLHNAAWTIEPKNQGEVGFQVALNGTSGDDRDTKLIWSTADTHDQSYTNPSLFGKLIFWQVNGS